MSDKIEDLVRIREEKRKETKDFSKAKKRRLVASAVLNTLVLLPKELHDKLRKYRDWETGLSKNSRSIVTGKQIGRAHV